MSECNLRMITFILALSIVTAGLLDAGLITAQPSGATIVSNETDTPPVRSAGSLTTAGGSFTTLVLNTTSQNQKWKAYVGNISGILTLDDASGQTIYDWNPAQISGEVYVSRNNSIDWDTVQCAQRSTIASEDQFMNGSGTEVDSINRTFNETVHQEFFVGGERINSSTCPAIATYVNDSSQTLTEDADFQEVLLEDVNNTLVYSTILEQDALSYNPNSTFDFQLIVAENEFQETPTTYYFYAELS